MEYGNKARQRVATRTCNSNADALRRPVLYCSVAALYAQLCVVFPSSARIVEFTRQQLRWARQWAPTGTGTLVPILHASHHITHHTSTRICIYFVGHKRQEVNWNSKSHFPSFSRPTLAWPQAQRRWQRTLVVAVAVAVAAAAVAAALSAAAAPALAVAVTRVMIMATTCTRWRTTMLLTRAATRSCVFSLISVLLVVCVCVPCCWVPRHVVGHHRRVLRTTCCPTGTGACGSSLAL